jgi:molecular chaperone DnaK
MATVEFGIDLGTTNSAIARMWSGVTRPEIVKASDGADIVPSVVAINDFGEVVVGREAYQRYYRNGSARKFKRFMGMDYRHRFENGIEMTPEELSSLVLKELKQCVHDRWPGLNLECAVISVPARFKHDAVEATRRAAELAHIEAASLIQEPIAAANASLGLDTPEGLYLVYDLGGGTFDISVINLSHQQISVLGYGGDQMLGGADMDRAVLEWLLEKLFELDPDFEKPGQDEAAYHELLISVEQAKIQLSRKDATFIALPTEVWEFPTHKVELSREVLESLCAPIVERTIELTHRRLEESKLSPRDVRAILLVGGPTKAPMVRRHLEAAFGIRLESTRDPMTVVAEGAAIHASSLLRPQRVQARVNGRKARAEIEHDQVSPDLRVAVGGRVENVPPESEIRIVRGDKMWATGWFPLQEGNKFIVDVELTPNGVSEYVLECRDSSGSPVEVENGCFSIRHGIGPAKPLASYNIGIPVVGGTVRRLVRSDTPLPYRAKGEFFTTRRLRRGSTDELVFYVVEGVSEKAEDNDQLWRCVIRGSDVPCDITENSRVVVHIHLDSALRMELLVQFPDYDYEWKPSQPPRLILVPESLRESCGYALKRLEDLEEAGLEDLVLECHRLRSTLEKIEALIEDADEGDKEALKKADQMLEEVRSSLSKLEDTYGVEAAWKDANKNLGLAREFAQSQGDRFAIEEVSDLQRQAEEAYQARDVEALKLVSRKAVGIVQRYLIHDPGFWGAIIDDLRGRTHAALNQHEFRRHLQAATQALVHGNLELVYLEVVKALSLLPQSERIDLEQRYGDTGLR